MIVDPLMVPGLVFSGTGALPGELGREKGSWPE